MSDEVVILIDHEGQKIRLTAERRDHILQHPEMVGQFDRIQETVGEPQLVIATVMDESVHVYHRLYESTPVTRKYLLVAVKIGEDDAFVLTAFFSSRMKKGKIIWQA
jgi:hypothetical protein